MSKTSAGLLMYRKKDKRVEVFLVHPGGPFFKHRDDGIWGIPKGEQHDNEDLLVCAKREFTEETGIQIKTKKFLYLGFIEYNNKKVYAWAFGGGLPDNFVLKSNPSKFGWPEIDRGEFFSLEEASLKIHPVQKQFLLKLRSQT